MLHHLFMLMQHPDEWNLKEKEKQRTFMLLYIDGCVFNLHRILVLASLLEYLYISGMEK